MHLLIALCLVDSIAAPDTTVVPLAPIVVSSTRFERRVEDEPERVEVLAGEDISEKSLTRPGDVTTLVREIPGVRVQTTSPAIGAAGLRIQGLRSEYSGTLVDGLPLFGAQSTGLGLLQIPPLDLKQAEVIKGAATALYGPSALSGLLNIITKRPTDTPERTLLVNQTTRGGTDAALWLSRRFDDLWGATFLGNGHRQQLTDVNHDGWADLAGFDRIELRPRVFWNGEGGRSLMATLGTTLENREGGGDGDLRQHADTRHGDAGLTGREPIGKAGVLAFRAAWSGDWVARRQFDPLLGAVSLDDVHHAAFTEVTYLHAQGSVVSVGGAAFALEDHDGADLGYSFHTPSVFAQLTWNAAHWLSTSAAARLDAQDRYGTFVSPRVSALLRAAHGLDVRVSAGSGFHAPTPFTEETQALPLTRVVFPRDLEAERARSVSLDLTWRRGPFEWNATGFASRIEHPVLVVEDTLATLVNTSGPTNTHGFETYGFYDREPFTVTVDYSYLVSTEVDPEEGVRHDTPLTPRHSAGFDVAYEEDESGTRVGLEVFYVGRQALEHDPYRTESEPYATVGVLASQRVGPVLLYLNGENLADVRQSDHEPILLPQPSPTGRLAVDSWAPAEGRVLNGGVQWKF